MTGSEVTTIDNAVLEQKRTAWAKMGETVYKTEMQLQAMAQKAVLAVKMPQNIEEVPNAEASLKELKAQRGFIEKNRKDVTSRFDDLQSRLMKPEKSLDDPIKALSDQIISVKKAHETAERIKREIEEERKSVKERAISFLNQKDFEFKQMINNAVTKALTFALGEGNVTPDGLEEYLMFMKGKFTLVTFMLPPYGDETCRHLKEEEVRAIITENYKNNPNEYLTLYRDELARKFNDYSVAYQNKQQAVELARKQEEEDRRQLEIQKQNKETAARLESTATVLTPSVSPGVKALKKSYEIDMPDSVESALAIMAGFTANLDKCLPKLKVTKWFAFTPAQAGNALAKVKCDDNNFQPSGITFKEVDKL